MAKQNVEKIVRQIIRLRSRQRLVPLRRRQINVYSGLRGDYHVNKFEIKVKLAYAVTGNPFDMIDPVIAAVVEFDRREEEERARKITQIKSSVLKWASYLERTLSREMYLEFVCSLLPKDVVHVYRKRNHDPAKPVQPRDTTNNVS